MKKQYDLKDIWALNPDGMYDFFAHTFQQQMPFIKTIDEKGNEDSPENIFYKKYKNYIDVWNAKYGERDPKFISKKDALLSPEDFLMQGGLDKEYHLPKTSRDHYIFGEKDANEFDILWQQFKEDIRCKL